MISLLLPLHLPLQVVVVGSIPVVVARFVRDQSGYDEVVGVLLSTQRSQKPSISLERWETAFNVSHG
ncbi:unnamed protein product, partial [Tilletia caries]